MKYESVILELLSRVQKLETEVTRLYSIVDKTNLKENIVVPDKSNAEVRESSRYGLTQQIYEFINDKKNAAKAQGLKHLELNAGDIERECNFQHKTPIVVNAMRKAMREKDVVVNSSQSGYSTTFSVNYYLDYTDDVKSKKGQENEFVIKMGYIPEADKNPLLTRRFGDDIQALVFDVDGLCVGVVWKHNENRLSNANGQAEIFFFDRYYNVYGRWHRMFDNGYHNGNRLAYDDLLRAIEKDPQKHFIYNGYIRP